MREENDPAPPLIGVKRLSLGHFRNIESLDLDLDPGFNVVQGPNGQGKTNLLESLVLISTTRLLRTSRDAEAIMHGQSRAIISGVTFFHESSLQVILERGIRKRASLNGVHLKRASDLIGRLPTVSLSSLDLEIARGEPSDRRLFLDLELSQSHPCYLMHLGHYKRALEQRNALLKLSQDQMVADELFESWEAQLAESGAELRRQRRAFIEELSRDIAGVHPFLAPGERLEVSYAPKDLAHTAEEHLAALAGQRRMEIARGSTMIGPHRDEMLMLIDGQEARSFGSQGQQRTAVLSLKLATLELARRHHGGPPLLLLDDMLSDLDERRRAQLVEWVLEKAGQAVLTCTEAEAAGPEILRRAKLFNVFQGQVSEA
jgi:DNA replication and repair protein RecF